MSHESLNRASAALQAYDAGLKFIRTLNLLPSSRASTKSIGQVDKPEIMVFKEQRELWRWIERLLRRRAILACRKL